MVPNVRRSRRYDDSARRRHTARSVAHGARYAENYPKIDVKSPPEAKTDLELGLTLYSLVESPALKNEPPQWTLNRELEPSPLTLDLYYLLTSYNRGATGSSATADMVAHERLGHAMRVFYENGIVRGTQLRGALAGTDTELRVTQQPISVEDMTRIWSAYPNEEYAPSVCYLVTPVPVRVPPEPGGPRVIRRTDVIGTGVFRGGG